MPDPILMKRGDTRPGLRVKLRYQGDTADSAKLVDATGVMFRMADAETASLKIEAAATIEDVTTGQVIYHWADGDTDVMATYRAEFVVTYVDGSHETFPSDEDGIPIIVGPKVDDEGGRSC